MAEINQCIAFVADMHIAPEQAGSERAQSSIDRPVRRRKQLNAVLADIAQYKPETLFFGGDNTNQPMDRAGYTEQLMPILEHAPRPWKIIPGNHDIGSTVGWHHHDPEAMSHALAAYRNMFGRDFWKLETAGFQVIGVNSQLFGSSLQEAEEQEAWLTETLQKKLPSNLLRILFLHTPPYLQNWDDVFSDGSEQMCLTPRAREACKHVLLEYPIDILLTAHAHRYWVQKESHWWWVGLPATALPLSEMKAVPDHYVPRGEDQLGWVSFERNGGSWKAELHPLNNSK